MLQGGLEPQDAREYAKTRPTGSRRTVGASNYSLQHPHQNHHLRSGNAVMRYYVHASDGDIGHVEGILIDERSSPIHYVIVNTSNWWMGHQTLLAPEWIDDIDWAESKLMVDLPRQSVKDAPRYDPDQPFTVDPENLLHGHYRPVGYRPPASAARSHR